MKGAVPTCLDPSVYGREGDREHGQEALAPATSGAPVPLKELQPEFGFEPEMIAEVDKGLLSEK